MPVTIYHRGATRSLRNIWLCEELIEAGTMNRSDFKVVDVPEPTPPEYAKVHRGMRIPAADIDGDVIFESAAILMYTLEKYGKGTLQGQPTEKAKLLQWIHFAETATQAARTPTTMGVFPGTKDWTLADVRKETSDRITNAFGTLEENLSNQDYMLKSGFSAVDIQTCWGLNGFFNLMKLADPAQYPKTKAYLDRCTARPAYSRAFEFRKPDPNRAVFGKL